MTSPALDDRYGRKTSRRTKLVGWGLVGAIALGFFGYLGYTTVVSNMNKVSVDDLGFTVVDRNTVNIAFQFTAPRGRDVVCAMEALDEDFGVVGYQLVKYPGSDSHAQKLSADIKTVATATTGLVSGCWVA